ncbi:syntenin-1-like [Condylostylus longicornis]|uniref:syntenin-1-like n=1 Tax=Condylostylus longicornis TaxID=2530218 RepID=UPI00244E51DB|nr:syntenin-1-like [Condylostylus longicornis]
MSLYPTLEDMQIDKMVQAQRTILNEIVQQNAQQQQSVSNLPSPDNNQPAKNNINNTTTSKELYPALGNFLGLELSEDMIRQNMPEYILQENVIQSSGNGYPVVPRENVDGASHSGVIAPLTGTAAISSRAQVNHNIRELILCKDANGKAGLRVQAIDNGIFVSIVVKNSPAALAGLRFGDQILQLNGTLVAGYAADKIHKILKKADQNNISLVVRDRPFERTVTLLKDSSGGLGFQFKSGKITTIVKDSSAARNGILTNHNILEINGQTVVAMKDKEITKILNEADRIVKITIIPTFIYEHLVKKLDTSFLRGIMDHSIPDF